MANKRAGVQEADMLFTQQTPINLAGAPADSVAFAPGAAAVVIQWGWNITIAMDYPTIQPIITLDVAGYNDVLGRAQIGTYTFLDNALAANAVIWQDFPGFETSGYPVAEGQRIIIEHQIAGTGGTATGRCRVFVVYRMTGQ